MPEKGFQVPVNPFTLKEFKDAPRRGGGLGRAAERRLLRDARAGDRRALTRLFELVATPALRFGRGFCRHDDDAEDIMQEVLAALARSMDRLRGESSLSTWAYTVARRACVRKRRRRAGAPDRLESIDAGGPAAQRSREVPDPSSDPHEDLERGELREAITRALATLPPAHREAVILRDVEGLSAREAAGVLGIGERALKSRLHRGRDALRRALAPAEGRETDAARTAKEAPRPEPRDRGEPSAGDGCPDVAGLVSRYLEGDLDRSVCDRVQRHVRNCARCAEICSQLRIVLGACRTWGTAPLSPDDKARVRAALRSAIDAA